MNLGLENVEIVKNLRNAGYDEIVVLPHRKTGCVQVIDFGACWAPLCGFNQKATPMPCHNIKWVSHNPPLPIIGEMHLHTFLCHEIDGQNDRPSHQLQRLKAWQLPTPPYIVSVNPTVGDLVDTLVHWATKCRHVTGLKIIAWKHRCEKRHFLFQLSAPIHFVKFRVSGIEWNLTQTNEYNCTMKGRAYNKKFSWLKNCPCSHEDLLKYALQSGCVVTICIVDKQPFGIVHSQYKGTNKPELPLECVVEDGRVRLPKDMRIVLEICNFFNRAVKKVFTCSE